ncbi:KR-domain-containing protein [Periconia macrospinosa]|uniref:KR-domain-containing protein n=1 Tax=Periconia macrospinosa TaxID=97972 RepID=A0A2V1D7I1_9PLEO|nr:KR-domain-containing protein [Periconia macrospinosa]
MHVPQRSLTKDQSVLIHSACGEVGIVAIQICQMQGAEIYTTVGNEEKAQYLVDTFQIPRSRIFDSRSDSFLASLMNETQGRGVDLVLNSLSGELLHASWSCVAPYGKMLIGKRDFIGKGMLAMDVFLKNRSFVGIDLGALGEERPEECRRLLQQCLGYYNRGFIQPIKPIKCFAAHMGKIVINMPPSANELSIKRTSQTTQFRGDACYILVGGLGGLGRAISTWMVECGARNLIYLSRSAGKSAVDQAFFSELEAQNCHVTAVLGSVSSMEDIERAVGSVSVPIAGVMQMSMVLRDQNFLQMKHKHWIEVVAPKVNGTWNLHNALKKVKLDFFLLFSSIAGVVGQWGQSNYASANTFLDSFVQYRHTLSLPASVINICAMKDIGYLAENEGMIDRVVKLGTQMVGETELLRSISLAIEASTPKSKNQRSSHGSEITIGLGSTKPLDDPTNRLPWKRDVRMALYRNRDINQETVTIGTDHVKNFIESVASDPDILNLEQNLGFLTREIGLCIKSMIFNLDDELDPGCKLTDAGVDSLVSIEIRNWWRRMLGLEISALEIMNAGTLGNLGKIASEGLRQKHTESDGSHPVLVTKAP